MLLPSEHFHIMQLAVKAMHCPLSKHLSLNVLKVHLQHIMITEDVQLAHKRTSTTFKEQSELLLLKANLDFYAQKYGCPHKNQSQNDV